MLFDGASLVLYMIGLVIYVANIVKGLRVVTAGLYDADLTEGELGGADADVGGIKGVEAGKEVPLGRDDSLKVLAASNTILALVLVGVLVLQAGQWYAERKEKQEEQERMRGGGERAGKSGGQKVGSSKKKI